MYTKAFWKDTGERVLATFLQALLAVMLVDGFDIYAVDWKGILSTAGLAAGIALVKSVLSVLVVGTPSMTRSAIPSGDVAATLADGRFLAGPASPIPTNTPVAVNALTYGNKSAATYYPEQGPGDGG
jgi:hypothetical protein